MIRKSAGRTWLKGQQCENLIGLWLTAKMFSIWFWTPFWDIWIWSSFSEFNKHLMNTLDILMRIYFMYWANIDNSILCSRQVRVVSFRITDKYALCKSVLCYASFGIRGQDAFSLAQNYTWHFQQIRPDSYPVRSFCTLSKCALIIPSACNEFLFIQQLAWAFKGGDTT